MGRLGLLPVTTALAAGGCTESATSPSAASSLMIGAPAPASLFASAFIVKGSGQDHPALRLGLR
ncbi:MAG: hypothetical protein KA371_13225 [Acidobacteria bacterium]|nr:hypothetical protein [Acidobacteriota bacterium]